MPDAKDKDAKQQTPDGWMGDVQRAIAMILIGSLALVCVFLTLRLIFLGESEDLLDMAKTLQAALVNMALIALGFFFGSNKASKDKDDTIRKIALEPVAPIAPVAVVAPVAPVAPIAPLAPVQSGNAGTEGRETIITTAPAEPSVTPTITTVTTEEPKKD